MERSSFRTRGSSSSSFERREPSRARTRLCSMADEDEPTRPTSTRACGARKYASATRRIGAEKVAEKSSVARRSFGGSPLCSTRRLSQEACASETASRRAPRRAAPDLRLEAHVEHPVRLVEHHVVALVEHEVPPVERVVQPARRRDHHLHALVGDEALLLDGHAADDGVDADLELAAKLARLVLDLLDQLARRRHDEREWAVGRRLARDWRLAEDVDEHRQHEGARLAGAGLCDADHVLDGEPERDSHHLDGGRLLVPRLSDGREDLRR
mmetsp:Transcript_13983/g.41259  ORF Transcript_13983/g.41259 Transcript_13983/m.41259 type:complete len:270 (-) Transcript_13983:310-1119(-)